MSDIEVPILRILYPPDGAIPATHVERIPAIRKHISDLVDLASCVPLKKAPRRITDPDESAALDAAIVKLWESFHPDGRRRTWAEVTEALGSPITPLAARKRYAKAKRAENEAMSGETALLKRSQTRSPRPGDQIFNPAGNIAERFELNEKPPEKPKEESAPSQPPKDHGEIDPGEVVKKEDPPTSSPEPPAALSPDLPAEPIPDPIPPSDPALKLPHSADDTIYEMRTRGEKFKDIVNALKEDGYFQADVPNVAARFYSIDKLRAKPAATPKVPLNKMDSMILEMAEKGAMDHEICLAVGRNFRQSFTVMEMRSKIRALQDGLA